MRRLSTTKTVPLLAVFLGASTALAGRAEEHASCRPEVWADAMAKFEQQDASEPPPQNGVLFVGSSSIRMWDLKKSFPDLPAINRGFGGSQICDATHFADVLVTKHQPRVVVLYAGDNDMAAGKNPADVHGDFRAFVAKVRGSLPNAKLVYISIKPSIARWKLANNMQEANRLIAAECAPEDDNLAFVDVWTAMLGDDGRPRPELLRDDRLHLTDAGYELWTKLVRPHLAPGQ